MDGWTDRLSEYVDGDLPAADVAALEAHLEHCVTCRTAVVELEAVRDAARSLADVPPAPHLWDDILHEIRQTPPGALPFRARPQRMQIAATVPQLAAAAIAVMLLSGGTVWLALRDASPRPAPAAIASPLQPAGTDAAPAAQTVAMVEGNYDLAIRDLQILLAASRDRLDPGTVEVIERNLAIIDAAIDDARRAIASTPGDVYLYRHLNGTLMKKVDLLRRATNLARAQT